LVQFDDDDTGQHFRDWITQKERSDSPSGIGESVYTGGFYIDAKHTGRIPPGMGHDALISLCGYLLKKYPDISWTDYKGLCYARWQEFDQSQFTWEWREAEYQIQKCWDTFERGKMFDEWMKTQNPFQGLISNPTAKPFTGTITDPTARPYIEAGR